MQVFNLLSCSNMLAHTDMKAANKLKTCLHTDAGAAYAEQAVQMSQEGETIFV